MGPANSEVLSTPKAAAILGVSRQHLATLGDRGVIPCWRVGTHRRFRRDDLEGYRVGRERAGSSGGDLGTMTLSDRRSFVFGLLVAAKLAAEPEAVVARARKNLVRLRRIHDDGSADTLLDRWEELLDGPADRVIAVLGSPAPECSELRHASPFAGVLTEAERTWVIRATRAAT